MARILAVDDALANLRQVALLLDGRHTVLAARSGAQALRIASAQSPDLILLDIDMPDLDGFETSPASARWTASPACPSSS